MLVLDSLIDNLGFDSDVAFAVSRTGDVYVWGKRTGPTGLPLGSSLGALTKLTYGHDSDLDSSDEEAREEIVAKPINQQPKGSSDAMKRASPTERIEEDGDEREDPNESDDEEEEGGDEDFVNPVKLLALCGEGISHIAVGRVHCCARTKDGDVYTWGQNDHCQLGTEPLHNLSEALSKKARVRYGVDSIEPRLWERTISEACVISSVDVGTNHTFAVTNKGEMLAYGAAYNTNDHSSLARSVAKLQVNQKVCAGMYHNAALSVDDEVVRTCMISRATRTLNLTSFYQVFTWGSNSNGCLGRPEELGDLEENFCAVPGRVEGMENFVGRPCSSSCLSLTLAATTNLPELIERVIVAVACGREFTLIATKPYIGPTREEVERRKQEQVQQTESIVRQTTVVKDEKLEQLKRIRQGKHAAILAHLNTNFPKCSICTTGLICPGFQPNHENPTLCIHCMHENRKHQDQRKAHDRTVTLAYLTQAVEKLGIAVDFSDIPDIDLEEELEFEVEEGE
ncbi:unnamed protein product [Phytophthora fragariaefolia]|uniref:Unnamed protein product n=1 Tax=Phytophthora fragariaefolia TaxID=1490495 RepID=A0A9W6XFR1_9STRA|nr:unnamed protein product [Phytophthora fragariaefolia]